MCVSLTSPCDSRPQEDMQTPQDLSIMQTILELINKEHADHMVLHLAHLLALLLA